MSLEDSNVPRFIEEKELRSLRRSSTAMTLRLWQLQTRPTKFSRTNPIGESQPTSSGKSGKSKR